MNRWRKTDVNGSHPFRTRNDVDIQHETPVYQAHWPDLRSQSPKFHTTPSPRRCGRASGALCISRQEAMMAKTTKPDENALREQATRESRQGDIDRGNARPDPDKFEPFKGELPAGMRGAYRTVPKPDTAAETKADVIEETRPKGGSLEPAHPKPTPESAAPHQLTGPMLLGDVQSALSDRYPHNDIHTLEGKIIEVKVPGGVILVDFAAVNKCANTAELRAYIDSLPIQ